MCSPYSQLEVVYVKFAYAKEARNERMTDGNCSFGEIGESFRLV